MIYLWGWCGVPFRLSEGKYVSEDEICASDLSETLSYLIHRQVNDHQVMKFKKNLVFLFLMRVTVLNRDVHVETE